MKIGILTFHSQLNYGGVLQALASQEALRAMGYEAIVIDRWLDERNEWLLGSFPFLSKKEKIKNFFRASLLTGIFSYQRRHKKTIRFLRTKLNLTPYHFYQWKEMEGKDLGVDVLYVGSDQVWNGAFGKPRPYLLEDAPTLPAIAYAASFGMRALPEDLLETYRQGFARFKAIGCREAEGVKLVEQEGFKATHVVDPTLLLELEQWKHLANTQKFKGKTLVCYLLREDVYEVLPKLKTFAKRMKCKVKIFVDKFQAPLPKTRASFKMWFKVFSFPWFSRVNLCLSGDPQDFLDAHAFATWVVTDSFHSVMFSSIFNKNVRVLRPKLESRKAMFARIEEFANHLVTGPMVSDSLDAALASFEKGETITFKQDEIATLRNQSKQWLTDALKDI